MTAKRRKSRIGVVGLGYVGLPLAVEFGKQYETIGFDVNPKRLVRELQKQGAQVDIYDPWASRSECRHEYGLQPVRALKSGRYDVAIVAVAHRQFRELGARAVRKLCKTKHVLYDIKHVFPAAAVDGRL